MFCEHCGTKMEEDEKFCPNCGRKVEAEESGNMTGRQAERAGASNEQPYYGEMETFAYEEQNGGNGRKKKKTGLIVGVILAIVIILVISGAATIFLLKKSQDTKEAEAQKQEEIDREKEEEKETEKEKDSQKEEEEQAEEDEEKDVQEEKELPEQTEVPGIATGLVKDGEEIYMADFNVSASSTLKESGYDYNAKNLMDVDASTCWADGVSGDGTNENFLFTSSEEQTVSGLAVLPGFCVSSDLYYKNAAPETIRIEFADEVKEYSFASQELSYNEADPLGGMVYIDFGQEVKLDECKVTILGVRDGNKYDDCCITEMFLYK